MKTIALCLFCLLSLAEIALEQDDVRIISGVIVDKQTHKPLSNAVMHTAECSYLADEQGRIAAQVKVGDVVAFTHVGYQMARMRITDTLAYQSIFSIMMVEDTLMLSEVIVRPREVNLERLARTMPLKIRQEDEVAKMNFAQATLIALSAAPQIVDAQMAQSRQIDAFVSEQVNRGMIAPNQMISISPMRIIAFIAAMRHRQNVSTYRPSNVDIRPIDTHEIESLLGK